MPLPNVAKSSYPEGFKDSLPHYSAERLSVVYGVPEKYVKYASAEYTSAPDENYGIHKLKTLRFGGGISDIPHDVQYRNVLKLLDSGQLWGSPPSLIVINSPHIIDVTDEIDSFLSHLMCSLAHRIIQRKAPRDLDINYLETMQLDHTKHTPSEKNLIIWGPVTDSVGNYECLKTTQLLYSFRRHTRILLTSTVDMVSLLSSFKVSRHGVTYFFNLDSEYEEAPVERVKTTKSPKAKPPQPAKSPADKVRGRSRVNEPKLKTDIGV